MYPIKILEWFHDGEWHEIGWRADTPKKYDDLLLHAYKLARFGDQLRIVSFIDREVLKTWNLGDVPVMKLDELAAWIRELVMGAEFCNANPWRASNTSRDYWRGKAKACPLWNERIGVV